MLIFHAGCESEIAQEVPRGTVLNALISYYRIDPLLAGRKNYEPLAALKERMGWRNLMLDCGAFSADRMGKRVDVDRYARYITDHKDAIDIYISLDEKRNPEGTRRNWERLKDHWGLNPMPVFQLGSDEKNLKHMMKTADGSFAIGNVVGHPFPKCDIRRRLDQVFYMNRDYGHKIHFFGSSARWVHMRYPFYSCDSTQWLLQAAYGTYQLFNKASGNLVRGKMRKQPKTLALIDEGMSIAEAEGAGRGTIRRIGTAKSLDEYACWLTETWRVRGVLFDDLLHRRAYPEIYLKGDDHAG